MEPYHSGWERIPEREKVKFPIDKSLIGKVVATNRITVRVGYYFQYWDLQEWDFNISELVDQKIAGAVKDIAPNLSPYQTSRLVMMIDRKQYLRKVQDEIMAEKREGEYGPIVSLKVPWYIEVGPPLEVKITGIARRWHGEHHRGYPAGYDYEGSDPYLDRWIMQLYYTATILDHHEYFVQSKEELIHPFDVLWVLDTE